jgi:hypothetical protein
MNKIKLVVVITIVGFLGLQYTFIEQTQDPTKDQMKNKQIVLATRPHGLPSIENFRFENPSTS